MIVLVMNAGSSTLKSQLIDTANASCHMKSLAEKIGTDGACMSISFPDKSEKLSFDMPGATHADSLEKLMDVLEHDPNSPITSLSDIQAIGNRIVSGGEYFDSSVIVDEDVLEKVKICGELAPLHNPHAATCIEHLFKLLPSTPQVTVFDNAFHMTMPAYAYRYPLPTHYYTDYKIRRYGAHGTSHRYAAQQGAAMAGIDLADSGIITCHLGSGGSLAAVSNGRCIDTTMGLTPLEGIMMGTRTGTMDPSIVTYIMRREGLSPDDMDTLMNKKSGFLGVTGISDDVREVQEAADAGNEVAQLALDMYVYRVQKAIGQFFAILPKTDVIAVTAGIGENSIELREQIFAGLEHLGIKLDKEKNARAEDRGTDRVISLPDSPITVCVVTADEELCIARETDALVSAL